MHWTTDEGATTLPGMHAHHATFAAGPLIRARALSGFAALVARHGGDVQQLLEGAGIAPAALEAPEATLSLAAMMALLDNAAERLAAPDFGLQLAQLQDLRVLGPVALIARHSATVGTACAAIARNLPYHSPGLQMHLEDDPERRGYSQFRFELVPGAAMPRRHMVELCTGMAERFLRKVTDDSGHDWVLHFRHGSTLSAAQYRGYFTGPVRLGQGRDSLSFPSALLQVPIAPDGKALRQAAERWVGNAMRSAPLDLCRQVETLIVGQLATGGANLIQVALQLGLHERTLQRRLKAQGVYFEALVDTVRRKLAEEYLSFPTIPLAEVASILGYSEQSSLNRACWRWFEASPHAYRKHRVAAGQ